MADETDEITQYATYPVPEDELTAAMLRFAQYAMHTPEDSCWIYSRWLGELTPLDRRAICELSKKNLTDYSFVDGMVYLDGGEGSAQWYVENRSSRARTHEQFEDDDIGLFQQRQVVRILGLEEEGRSTDVRIQRLCENDELKTNGLTGKAKRITLSSLIRYAKKHKMELTLNPSLIAAIQRASSGDT